LPGFFFGGGPFQLCQLPTIETGKFRQSNIVKQAQLCKILKFYKIKQRMPRLGRKPLNAFELILKLVFLKQSSFSASSFISFRRAALLLGKFVHSVV
jgi:hypothetical protein